MARTRSFTPRHRSSRTTPPRPARRSGGCSGIPGPRSPTTASPASSGSLRPRDVYAQPTGVPFHGDRPWPAAHRAVFDQQAGRVRVDVEVHPLAAVRATNADGVLHGGILTHAGRNVTPPGRRGLP